MRFKIYLGLGVLAIVGLLIYLGMLWRENPAPLPQTATVSTEETEQSTQAPVSKQQFIEASSEASAAFTEDSSQETTTLPSTTLPPGPVIQRTFTSNPEMMEHVEKAVQQIQNNLQYPLESLPLETNHYDILTPNQFVPVEFPMDAQGHFTFSLSLPKFQFFHGESIPVTFRIRSNQDIPIPGFAFVKAQIEEEDKIRAEFELKPTEDGETSKTFEGTYQANAQTTKDWGKELYLKVRVQLHGHDETSIGSLFQYVASIAHIKEKGQEKVEGAFLVIPLKLSVEKTGHYLVTANLFGAEGGDPIAHLSGRNHLTGQEGEVLLKAHASVLRLKKASGPYLLKTFTIERIPDYRGEESEFGASSDQSFKVQGFDLALYSNEPYVDEKRQKKLQALQDIVNQKRAEQPATTQVPETLLDPASTLTPDQPLLPNP